MIYLQKSKRKNKKFLFTSIFIFVFLIASLTLLIKAPGPLGAVVRSIGMPFWSMENYIGEKTHFISDFFVSKNVLIAENDVLKAELDLSREKLIVLDTLNSEHTKLLESFNRSTSTKKILATILVRPPQTPYDILILDVGSNDGISMDDIVYSIGGIALGKIYEISDHTSKTALFSSTNIETSAIVERTGLAITLHGIGGGSFEMQVPQETDILKNDMIILPKLETTIIGQVVDVESSIKSAFKRVLIQTPVNVSYARFVFVKPIN